MARPWSVLIALGAGLAVLGGIIFVGRLTRDDLDRRGHYTLMVADLAVAVPPGLTRDVFLAEVMYQGRLSATLDRTDAATTTRLNNAFAAHPWVEKVKIDDLAKPQPVTLTFRVPTLVVHNRVLDRLGVLLPRLTKKEGLPEYRGTPAATDGPSGAAHPDAAMVKLAKSMAWFREQLPDVKWQTVELTGDGLVLTRTDGTKAIWGNSKPPEPTPDQKIARMKAWKTGNLDLRTP